MTTAFIFQKFHLFYFHAVLDFCSLRFLRMSTVCSFILIAGKSASCHFINTVH